MVDSGGWLVTTAVELVPAEWSALNTEAPNVVYWLSSGVATIDKKVRLREDD